MSFRADNEDSQAEHRDPCATGCGKPYLYDGFWGRKLCESCWFSWKKCMDDACDAAGKALEPGPLFATWFEARNRRAA